MSSTDNSSVRRPGLSASHYAGNGWCTKGKWTPVNIAAMVFSFMIFWPLGLFLVFWICSGRDAMELVGKVRTLIHKFRGSDYLDRVDLAGTSNSNKVFQEYQQTQYDRIHELKAEIRERATRFNAFRSERKRREDQEEFNLFMATSPARNEA